MSKLRRTAIRIALVAMPLVYGVVTIRAPKGWSWTLPLT